MNMQTGLILAIVGLYFLVLLVIAFYTSRNANNSHFFIGEKKSKWYLVAYGMIGTSLSGVTFMSVPGKVVTNHFFYMQIVIGYLLGYVAVAFILLPLYYKLQLTSIYTFLEKRFGNTTYKTGASLFLISRTLGASLRIYLVLYVLQTFLLDSLGVPFVVTSFVVLLMILLYTYKGGVKTIVWTDTLQTTFMIFSLILTIGIIAQQLNFSIGDIWSQMKISGYADPLNFDIKSPAFFLKQIIAGMFVTIAMTGLDQEMMQKNISIKTLGEAQKNMLTFSVILFFVNFLFLFLGGALYVYAAAKGIPFSKQTDDMFPLIALQYLPPVTGIVFIVGLVSALFPSADGAMTALTSSFCIDILGLNKKDHIDEAQKTKTRMTVHTIVAVVFFLIILFFKALNQRAIIDLVLEIAGYTYGPLLGLFIFGMYTKLKIEESAVPIICVLSPLITFLLKTYSAEIFNGYQIGFEILLINALITIIGLFISSKIVIEKNSNG